MLVLGFGIVTSVWRSGEGNRQFVSTWHIPAVFEGVKLSLEAGG